MKYVHKRKGLAEFPFGCNGLNLFRNNKDMGKRSFSPYYLWDFINLDATRKFHISVILFLSFRSPSGKA